MTTDTIADLYRHMEWADAAVWKAVLASESAQTDGKLQEYLLHLHVVQRVFLLVWRGEPLGTTYPKFDDAKSLMLWARGYYSEALAHLASLGDGKLSEPMALPWANMVEKQLGRPPDVTTAGETALQVPLHTMYHRGQVNARLKIVGGEPPLVDYIAWVWSGRPAPDWPSVESSGDL
ncbi:MAG TPA: damage-inducible protein DinB [Blastocatellia bacterium]|nr:damage-inducible protein DinB [Blastocatellia bacterium]